MKKKNQFFHHMISTAADGNGVEGIIGKSESFNLSHRHMCVLLLSAAVLASCSTRSYNSIREIAFNVSQSAAKEK
jgi:hypothetical protein